MRPHNLQTKIFLDSGDPEDTRKAIKALGFLDGQTTNPSLVAKNPNVQAYIQSGHSFSKEDAIAAYKNIILEIAALVPEGSVSVEVPADATTSVEEMYVLGKEMNTWIPNAHIKYPIIPAGLEAAERLITDGLRVNMTLCFTQEQALAVHSATLGAKQGDVFVSPFVGRIHDRKENDEDLLKNIARALYQEDSRVELLAASIRDLEHFLQALSLRVDIITAPLSVLEEWAAGGKIIPEELINHATEGFAEIAYQDIDVKSSWREYDITHELTDAGLKRFTDDWNTLLGKV